MAFKYPISSICSVKCQQREFLVAVVGPSIRIFDAKTGSCLSSWPSTADSRCSLGSTLSPEQVPDSEGSAELPGQEEGFSTPSSDRVASIDKNANNKKRNLGNKARSWSTIPIIVPSKTGDHIVAVTGEDKCLRVFQLDSSGSITHLTERCMPKKPCAVTLTSDNSSILCGDKFGDVYSIPLLPKEWTPLPSKKNMGTSKPFQPSATTLTVHTETNRRALEQQMKNSPVHQEKTELSFEHKFLLGHVSMLTSLALVSVPTDCSTSFRQYIITSDRDEHIRVSRGPPQTHIIHGYCLGHTSFVSKLCIPKWDPKILVSGGGDDFVVVWNWLEGRISQKIPLRCCDDISEEDKSQPQQQELTVSGIYAVPLNDRPELQDDVKGAILVSLEGSANLLPFSCDKHGKLTALRPIELSGNALDVMVTDDEGTVVVSVDNIHTPNSTKQLRKFSGDSMLLQCFILKNDGNLKWEEGLTPAVEAINSLDDYKISEGDTKHLSSSLYGLGNLRKWPGAKEDDA